MFVGNAELTRQIQSNMQSFVPTLWPLMARPQMYTVYVLVFMSIYTLHTHTRNTHFGQYQIQLHLYSFSSQKTLLHFCEKFQSAIR